MLVRVPPGPARRSPHLLWRGLVAGVLVEFAAVALWWKAFRG